MTSIQVEVIYLSEQAMFQKNLELSEGATIEDAIQVSGLLESFTELVDRELVVGVYGKKLPMTQRVSNGDRVEVYRPLLIDPKEARRQRAEEKRKNKKA